MGLVKGQEDQHFATMTPCRCSITVFTYDAQGWWNPISWSSGGHHFGRICYKRLPFPPLSHLTLHSSCRLQLPLLNGASQGGGRREHNGIPGSSAILARSSTLTIRSLAVIQ